MRLEKEKYFRIKTPVQKLHVLHLCKLIQTELWNGKYHEILHSTKKLVRQIVQHGVKWQK